MAILIKVFYDSRWKPVGLTDYIPSRALGRKKEKKNPMFPNRMAHKRLGFKIVVNLLTQWSRIQCPHGRRTGRTDEQKQLQPTAHSVDPQAFSLSIICPRSVPSFADSLPSLKNTLNHTIKSRLMEQSQTDI